MMFTAEILLLGAISPVIGIGFVFLIVNSLNSLKRTEQLNNHRK